MSKISELLNQKTTFFCMTETEFRDLINDALAEINAQTEETDPISAYSLEKLNYGKNRYMLGLSYTGWSFETVEIEVVKG